MPDINPPAKTQSPFLLQTEEDFTIILEALDCYWRELATLSYAKEAANAALLASKDFTDDDNVTMKQFERSISSKLNKPKIIDSATRIRDKVILMKAKVVLTKEHLRQQSLGKAVEELLGDIC